MKLVEYRSILSLRRYVTLEQDQYVATVITRAETTWSIDVVRREDTLLLPEIGIEVPMAEIYADLVFPSPEEIIESR